MSALSHVHVSTLKEVSSINVPINRKHIIFNVLVYEKKLNWEYSSGRRILDNKAKNMAELATNMSNPSKDTPRGDVLNSEVHC